MTFGTVGVLAGAIMSMKFKADLKFQHSMKAVLRVRVVKPFIGWFNETNFGKWLNDLRHPKAFKNIQITMYDVGTNLLYQRNRSIGCTFKITREGKAQVTSVLPLSVAHIAGILPMMEVEKIQGVPRTFQSARE